MELYEIVWKEISYLRELYDKHFWSTRDARIWLVEYNFSEFESRY